MKKIIFAILSIILPFLIIIKCSVYLYIIVQLPIYISIMLGLLSGTIASVGLVMYWFKSYRRKVKKIFQLSLMVMVVFTVYGTFMLNESNSKSKAVNREFYSLHPIMRLAVGGLSIIDRSLVVTDMKRNVKDYDGMGLKRNHNSLHLIQSTGYVHAVDLRTKGRFFMWNWIVQLYFWLCGFDTLRHVGNADHLHISIPVR